MDKRDKRIDDIINHILDATTAAVEGMTDAVQTASTKVGEKYDAMKLSIELNRLQEEQRKLFTDMGRMLYLIKSRGADTQETAKAQMLDTQQTVDRLLLLADQKQLEIDHLAARLARLNGSKLCAVCDRVSDGKNAYCSYCGAPL